MTIRDTCWVIDFDVLTVFELIISDGRSKSMTHVGNFFGVTAIQLYVFLHYRKSIKYQTIATARPSFSSSTQADRVCASK